MASPQKVGTFTIANGASDSNVLTKDDFGRCRSLIIICVSAALTGAVTLECGDAVTPTVFVTVQSPPGTDVAIAADKGVALTAVPFPSLRLHSAAAEGGERVFEVWGQVGE